MVKNQKPVIYGSIILAMIFWSLSFIWYKDAFLFYKPLTTILLRLIVSIIFLAIVILISRKFPRIKKKDLKSFLLLAIFEPFLYFIGESLGMERVSSTVGAIIVATIPLFTPIAAWFFFKERIALINMWGIILSFFGVIVVLVDRQFQFTASPSGVAWMFLAVSSAVLYTGLIVNLSKNYKPLHIISIQNFLGIFLFAPLVYFVEIRSGNPINLSWEALTPIIKLGVLPSSLSFMFYTYTIKHIGITKSNIFTNFIPVFTAIFSYFILQEQFAANKIIGMILVIAGLLVSQLNFARKKQKSSRMKPSRQ